MPVSLALSPEGHLITDDWAEEIFCFSKDHEAAVIPACEKGSAAVLLWLASHAAGTRLPVPALYWRDFCGHWLMKFCHRRAQDLDHAEMESFLETFPPMRGSEYLSAAILQRLWAELGAEVARQVSLHAEGADGWLKTMPHWHLVGRVTLHLAENKRDVERPFAFLATYTSGLTSDGKARHVLLQQAIREYAGAENRANLLHLLEPVSLAAEKSPWLAGQVEAGAIYRQQAWKPADALKFLKEIKIFEECGLAVRIPDWWKPAAPPRPKVSVTVGGDAPSSLGIDSLLSFRIEVTLDGEPLSADELDTLRTAQGLVMVKGRWVEADSEKIQGMLKPCTFPKECLSKRRYAYFPALGLIAVRRRFSRQRFVGGAALRREIGSRTCSSVCVIRRNWWVFPSILISRRSCDLISRGGSIGCIS